MTRDEAEEEAARRREAEPAVTWTVAERADGWHVVRIGLPPHKSTGTATKPPPEAPQADPRGGRPDPNWAP